MLAKLYTYALAGLDAYQVTVEIDVSHGLPSMTIVGLPDNAIKESKERIRSAIKNSGYQFEPERITVNLAPANIKKEGPSFDLAIALGVLAATQQINGEVLSRYAILGELALDGKIRPVKGALSAAMAISPEKFRGMILPAANAREAALAQSIDAYPVRTLAETVHFLQNPDSIAPLKTDINTLLKTASSKELDFSDVKGQSHAKRGLEIAAAGGHNCLMMCSQYALNFEELE